MPQNKKVTKRKSKAKVKKVRFGNKILSTKLLIFIAIFTVVGAYFLVKSLAATSAVLGSQNFSSSQSVKAQVVTETKSTNKQNSQVVQLTNTATSTDAKATLVSTTAALDTGVYRVCLRAFAPNGTVTGNVSLSTYVGSQIGTITPGSSYNLVSGTQYVDATCFSYSNNVANASVTVFITNTTANGVIRIGAVNFTRTGSLPPPPPGNNQPPSTVTNGATWNSIFNDNFDGTSVNTANWNVQNNSTFGDGNNERQCYMAANTVVSGGSLKLIGKQQSVCGREYSSGMVTTKAQGGTQKFKFKYGYTEIRAKLPKGGGFWPAFWLVGADTAPGWPQYGEMDVFEGYGTYPCCVEETFHWYNGGHKQEGGQARDVGSTDNTDWHTYGLNWTSNRLDFYIDGVKRQTFTPSDSGATAALSYEHTIHVNLAIGGSGPEQYHGWTNGDWKSGELPGTYEVDYVRVWQK